jgi:hypothetical protein
VQLNSPFASVAGNNIETGLLTLHSIVTTLMTTLPFPLNDTQAAGMSGILYIICSFFKIFFIFLFGYSVHFFCLII